jgi:hypothetical protein
VSLKYEKYSTNYQAAYGTNKTVDNISIQAALDNKYQSRSPVYFCHTISKKWKFDPNVPINNRTNYVIATWSGPRRLGNDKFHDDSSYYLRRHLETLSELEHHLGQITIAVPENLEEPTEFTNYLKTIPATIGSTPIKILRREKNIGQSYGSYSDAFSAYGASFDFYIFMEDDYVFSKPNFDQIMIQMFESAEDCGYLSSYVKLDLPDYFNARPHAAVSNGICSTEALQSITKKFGILPYGGDSTEKMTYDCKPQLEFSYAFLWVGKRLYDYRTIYNAPFNHIGSLQMLGDPEKEALIIPLQF